MPAKGTSRFKVTDEMLVDVERLASQGLSQDQIALSIGCSRATLFKHKKLNKDFEDAIRKGQAKGIDEVSNALFTAAKSGNVVAQIFFLKNRAPNEWKDRHHVEETHRFGPLKEIDGSMSPADAAGAYADTLKASGSNVVPIKKT